jgi:hypothetical protein
MTTPGLTTPGLTITLKNDWIIFFKEAVCFVFYIRFIEERTSFDLVP